MSRSRRSHTSGKQPTESKAQTTRSRRDCTDTLLYILKAPFQYPALFIGLLLVGGAAVSSLLGKSSGQQTQKVVRGKSVTSYQDPTNSQNQHDPCRFFPLFKGVDPKKAKRILIGEFHTFRGTTIKTVSDCIDHLAPDQPHTILVEDAVSGVEVLCSDSDRGISEKTGRKCIGWNSKESNEKAESDVMQDAHAEFLKAFKSKYDDNFSKTKKSVKDFDKEADIFLGDLTKTMQKNIKSNRFDKYTHKPPAPHSSQARSLQIYTQALKTYQELHDLRSAGHTWKQIFALNTQHLAKDIKQEKFVRMDKDFLRTHYSSNVELLKTLRAQDPTSITFVIAGTYHLTPFDVPVENTAADYVLNGLEEDGIPYSVIAMRL